MKTKLIATWSTWVSLCESYDHDPYKTIEFGIDKGGGNSQWFEFTGDIPKKEE